MCLRVGGPDSVQEEHKRFILVRAEECPTSSGGEESCIICTEVLVLGLQAGEREGALRSQDVSGVCVFASNESNGLWICLLSSLKWSLPSPFIDARGTPGYMHMLCDIFPGKEDPRPSLLPCSW